MRQPERAASPAFHLPELRRHHPHRPVSRRRHPLQPLRNVQQERRHVLQQVRRPGGPATEIRHAGVPGARHDVCRSPQGHHPADGLLQGSRDAEEERPRYQGAGSLLRRNPADDGQRNVHHQRHRARHRFAVAPFARRVLRARSGAGLLPRQDHSLPRKLGGVRVRQQEHPLRPHRPQTQILRLGLPAGARLQDRRADSARVLPRQQDHHPGQEAALERG